MMDSKAADGLFIVLGQVTLKRVFLVLVVGHATVRIRYLITGLSLEESILVDKWPKSGSFKSNGVPWAVSDRTSCSKAAANMVRLLSGPVYVV